MLVPRALEVEKGKLCYVIGTVYMDMPLKPNVMVDIARDVSPKLSLRARLICIEHGVAIYSPTSSTREVLFSE